MDMYLRLALARIARMNVQGLTEAEKDALLLDEVSRARNERKEMA